jgi:vacuolar-type H+-ATPase subunit H
MIEEHLKRIRSKEEEARSRLASGKAEADAIVEKAREEGIRHLDEARTALSETERSLIAAARRSADEKISVLRAENAKKLAALVVLARKNQAKAIEMILKEFHGGA